MKYINDREIKCFDELQNDKERSKLNKLPLKQLFEIQDDDQERMVSCNGALTDFLESNRVFHNHENFLLDTLRLCYGHILDAILNENKPSSSLIAHTILLDLHEDYVLISELTNTSTYREITHTVLSI